MTAVRDLWALLKGDGIALDKAEAAALGGPARETISVWAAMAYRHGSFFAHLVCLALWVVQARHCQDQLHNVPMSTWNYVRAIIVLILFAPVAFAIGAIRRALAA